MAFRGRLGPVQITVTPVQDFAALGREWRALEARLPGHGVFAGWSWVGCLAEERFADPVLLRAEAGGRCLGLALFNRHRGRLCLNESGVPALDAPFIEHNAPLAEPAVAAALLRAAWGVRGARRLVISGAEPGLVAAAGGVAWRRQARIAPFVDLQAVRAAGGDALALCSANARQQIRRSDRFYAGHGLLALEAAGSVAEGLAFFDALVVLHTESWQARGQPGAFATDYLQRFHRALIAEALPRGEVELLRLRAGEQVVGLLYNLRGAGRVHAYQSGFDHAGAGRHGKPGLSLHAMAIARAAQAGDAVYDFLGGADRYKLSLATGEAALLWVELVQAWSLRGLAARLARRG
jgi:CelD/BcsL family acetyltransferase involved in cellulose biosynthesis